MPAPNGPLGIPHANNPLTQSVYTQKNFEAASEPPVSGDFLITEAGDFLITESGDFLITES